MKFKAKEDKEKDYTYFNLMTFTMEIGTVIRFMGMATMYLKTGNAIRDNSKRAKKLVMEFIDITTGEVSKVPGRTILK